MSRNVTILALKTAGGSSSAFEVPVDVDNRIPVNDALIARTTNPTAVADATLVKPSADALGRALVWPYQVRNLIFTASAAPTYGTEVTLLAGSAGAFHDLVEVTAANTSTQAFTVNLRSETGAGIVKVINIPANNTILLDFTVPVPQNTTAAAWTVAINNPVADQPDPGVTVSATFIRNV